MAKPRPLSSSLFSRIRGAGSTANQRGFASIVGGRRLKDIRRARESRRSRGTDASEALLSAFESDADGKDAIARALQVGKGGVPLSALLDLAGVPLISGKDPVAVAESLAFMRRASRDVLGEAAERASRDGHLEVLEGLAALGLGGGSVDEIVEEVDDPEEARSPLEVHDGEFVFFALNKYGTRITRKTC